MRINAYGSRNNKNKKLMGNSEINKMGMDCAKKLEWQRESIYREIFLREKKREKR